MLHVLGGRKLQAAWCYILHLALVYISMQAPTATVALALTSAHAPTCTLAGLGPSCNHSGDISIQCEPPPRELGSSGPPGSNTLVCHRLCRQQHACLGEPCIRMLRAAISRCKPLVPLDSCDAAGWR